MPAALSHRGNPFTVDDRKLDAPIAGERKGRLFDADELNRPSRWEDFKTASHVILVIAVLPLGLAALWLYLMLR